MSLLTISHIKELFKTTDIEGISHFIEQHVDDTRAGVKKIVESADKKLEAHNKEVKRIETMRVYENSYSSLDYIGGIDEVGRGPLAGPVVTAVVILKKDCRLLYLNDSKKVSKKMREILYDKIMEEAIAISIGIEDVATIDRINILQATYKAMQTAIHGLKVKPDILLVDAVTIPDIDIKQIPIIKGDEKSISIAAASIIAKVTRDRMMVDYDQLFPEYHFASNKGYGAIVHIEAIKRIGPCPIHRRSFIKNFI